jgi:hypothetical protein
MRLDSDVMSDAWQVVVAAGVPLGTSRGEPTASPERLAAAAREAVDREPATAREAEALAAWIAAWLHHWPTSFARLLADDAPRLVQWSADHAGPLDGHVKLRRIAIERLSRVL